MIDLHIHTTESDGTLTPTEVVELASKIKLKAVGITDHDCVKGVKEAQNAGKKYGIIVVPGVEVSVEFEGDKIHLLGYCLDTDNEKVKYMCNYGVATKGMRNLQIIEKLQEDGFDISIELVKSMVKELDEEVSIGRPHIARALISKGYASSVKEVFDLYIGDGKKYNVPREHIGYEEAVGIIVNAGGIPVLAHPLQYKYEEEKLFRMIETGISYGVQGLEAIYTVYTDEEREYLKGLARKFKLFYTGGSDFHGANKDIDLGIGHGDLYVPDEVLDNLI